MIKIPLENYKLYQARLRALDVSLIENAHYVKWVRYYLDFEAKYQPSGSAADVADAFIEKLSSKGQSAGLCQQARKAVHLYLEVSQPTPPVSAMAEPKSLVVASPETQTRSVAPPGSVPVAPTAPGRGGWTGLERAMAGEIKLRNYSPKTLSTYLMWVRRFGDYTGHLPVDAITDESAKDFLTDLAVKGHVVASTQNQAFNALLFLFRHILKRGYELGDRVGKFKGHP